MGLFENPRSRRELRPAGSQFYRKLQPNTLEVMVSGTHWPLHADTRLTEGEAHVSERHHHRHRKIASMASRPFFWIMKMYFPTPTPIFSYREDPSLPAWSPAEAGGLVRSGSSGSLAEARLTSGPLEPSSTPLFRRYCREQTWVPSSGPWLRGLEKAGGGLGLVLGLSGDMKEASFQECKARPVGWRHYLHDNDNS